MKRKNGFGESGVRGREGAWQEEERPFLMSNGKGELWKSKLAWG